MGSRSKHKWKEELQLHQRKVQQSKDNFKSKRNQLIREHTMSSKKPIIGRRTLELQWEFYQFCNCFSMIQWTIKRINKEINSFSRPTPLYKTSEPVWQLRNLMHHGGLPTVSFVTQKNNHYTILYRQELLSLWTKSKSNFNKYFGNMFTTARNSNKKYAELLPLVKKYTSKAKSACVDSIKQL